MIPLSCLFYRLLTSFPQSRLQAWLDSIPPADQPVFRTRQYDEVVELGDTLVAFLTPHYSADDVTRLFLPEPYPMPLPPLPVRTEPPPTEPLFLPNTPTPDPPLQTLRASSQRTPDRPAPGSLAAELAAEAAFQASAKDREAQQLDELIQNNTDPSGRNRHASKEKTAPESASGEYPSILSPIPSHFPLFLAVDISRLPKDADGLAIWPIPRGVAASVPQVPATVRMFSPSHYVIC